MADEHVHEEWIRVLRQSGYEIASVVEDCPTADDDGAQTTEPAMKYAVVFEQTPHNYSAYVPGLPGCIATGATPDDVERNIREAIAFQIEGLRLENYPVPEPSSWTAVVEASA